MVHKRVSGVLLHITSLPSPYGIGDMGSGAFGFVDFLAATGQKVWQILPLNPTDGACGHSPYSSSSAFAGNPLLISPEGLVEEGLIREEELPSFESDSPVSRVDFAAAVTFKKQLAEVAFQAFQRKNVLKKEFAIFCQRNTHWLEDYALFVVLKGIYEGKSWFEWQPEHRDRDTAALEACRREHEQRIEKEKFLQFVFYRQWARIKKYCHQKKIQLIGDLPIYVSYDSVDVWVNPELFKLNEDKTLLCCAGVPPDYFSKTGQLWGNPVYDWEYLQSTGFEWWLQRIEQNLKLFDFIRIDHFRGLVAYWEVPAGEETAENGKWVEVPVDTFMETMRARFSPLPILAEDLGIITDDVREVMKKYRIPGMRVLLFGFGEELKNHPYLPHNYVKNCLAYTGTHDNNTVRGWFEHDISDKEKENVTEYCGEDVSADNVAWRFIELVERSPANMVIIPMQDILNLGAQDRMNTPATSQNNWLWRLDQSLLTSEVQFKLKRITVESQR